MGRGVDEGEATRQRVAGVAGVAGVQTAESSLAVKLHCMHSSARCKPGPPVEILAAARDAPGGHLEQRVPHCRVTESATLHHSSGARIPAAGHVQGEFCCGILDSGFLAFLLWAALQILLCISQYPSDTL